MMASELAVTEYKNAVTATDTFMIALELSMTGSISFKQ